MPNFHTLLAPLALILPGLSGDNSDGLWQENMVPQPDAEAHLSSEEWLKDEALDTADSVQFQVRIEQRVIIRVSPRRGQVERNFMSTLPRGEQAQAMAERRIGTCIKTDQIVGVQPMQDNRLMLHMEDRMLIAANLEKGCSARDFYSGFYVEPSEDGKICIDRDKLRSRTGANCAMKRLRQIIPAQT